MIGLLTRFFGTGRQPEARPSEFASLPPPQRPSIVVPLDHEAVVPVVKPRAPYESVRKLFEAHRPAMERLCLDLRPAIENCTASDDPVDDVSPYWRNDFFTGMDARVAYAFVRTLRPSRIVEIGSGNSTRFLRKAIRDGRLATRLVSIDPAPRLSTAQVADQVIPRSVIEAPMSVFHELAEGDILFFDGSHLCFHGSDVTHFFLRVLPILAKGVFVHIHDIALPDDYPPHFDERYYNEQYLLAAFLLHNPCWSPKVPVHYLYGLGLLSGDGGSFWMRKDCDDRY